MGSYASTCSGADDPNYTFSYVGGSVSVTPAAAVITASSPTITYGDAAPRSPRRTRVWSTATPLRRPPPTCSTTATRSSAAGTYPSTCSGAADPNYTFTYVDGTVTVNAVVVAVPVIVTASSPDAELGHGSRGHRRATRA